MTDAGVSQVILKWSKNHAENYYLKIAILWADMASAVASLNDLKIQLWFLKWTFKILTWLNTYDLKEL